MCRCNPTIKQPWCDNCKEGSGKPCRAPMAGSIPPSDKRALQRGAVAASQGVVVGDNPYPENDNDHWLWIQGWTDTKLNMKSNDLK